MAPARGRAMAAGWSTWDCRAPSFNLMGLDGYLYQSLSLNILALLHTEWLLCGVGIVAWDTRDPPAAMAWRQHF
jgi:hypothetical protein